MRNKHLKLKTFLFDIDLSTVYLIPDLGPCFKTKAWDYYIPIYGNYEAIEYVIDEEVILNDENTNEKEMNFYRKELLKQVNKINSKIAVVEFRINEKDLEKYNLK
jgi:Zn/Cd-binding protein ZinT